MLRGWLLHERAHIPDQECKVWLSMHQVPEATDDAPVSHRVGKRCRALLAQLELGLNRDMARIASVHSAIAQDLPGIRCLAQRNALGILLHLNDKVKHEQPKVTH